jgi:hypothetical protein
MELFRGQFWTAFKRLMLICGALVAVNCYGVSIGPDQLSSASPPGWQGLMNKALFTESTSAPAPVVLTSYAASNIQSFSYGGLSSLPEAGVQVPARPVFSVSFLLLLSGILVWLLMRAKRLNTK